MRLQHDRHREDRALRAGYVTITPLQHDLTEYKQLDRLDRAWSRD